MTVNFELGKASKMTSLKICRQSWRSYQIWAAGKSHSKGSIEYGTSGGRDIIT